MSVLRLLLFSSFGPVLAACGTSPSKCDPDNPSATCGSSTSDQANAMADKAMYKPVEYVNAAKKGPQIVVIPGEIKSNNASFTQKFGPNNIADYAELELGKANFKVLERADLGPLLNEFTLAYTMGNPSKARKMLQKGKFKTTKWILKFDILKAEPVAQAFSTRVAGLKRRRSSVCSTRLAVKSCGEKPALKWPSTISSTSPGPMPACSSASAATLVIMPSSVSPSSLPKRECAQPTIHAVIPASVAASGRRRILFVQI